MIKIMEYWEKRYRDLEKKTEKNDAFINGCLPMILVGLAFIGLLVFGQL